MCKNSMITKSIKEESRNTKNTENEAWACLPMEVPIT
jgi:hypothetical protein